MFEFSLHFRTDAIKTHGAGSDWMDSSGYRGKQNVLLHVVHWEMKLTRDLLAPLWSIAVEDRESGVNWGSAHRCNRCNTHQGGCGSFKPHDRC